MTFRLGVTVYSGLGGQGHLTCMEQKVRLPPAFNPLRDTDSAALTFILARRRKRAGELIVCEPCRFLLALPQDDLKWEGGKRDTDPEEQKQRGAAHLANLRAMLE